MIQEAFRAAGFPMTSSKVISAQCPLQYPVFYSAVPYITTFNPSCSIITLFPLKPPAFYPSLF